MNCLLGLVAALMFITTTQAQSPAPRTLKMQASWPSTVTAWDNFRFIAERLDKTTGGAIKIETNAPDPREFSGRAQVSYSQNSEDAAQQAINGMVNIPLITDQLALRVVGYKRDTDGYIQLREPDFTNPAGFGFTDYSSQNIVGADGNDGDLKGGRVALAWTPSVASWPAVPPVTPRQVRSCPRVGMSASSPSRGPTPGRRSWRRPRRAARAARDRRRTEGANVSDRALVRRASLVV